MDARFTDYLNSLRTRNCSPLTIAEYERDLNTFRLFLSGADVLSVDRATITSYVSWLRENGLSATTTQRRLAVIHSFYRFLVETGALTTNPADGVQRPKRKQKLPVYFTEGESRALLESVDGLNRERDYAILLLALISGLRVSEIVSLNVSDIQRSGDVCFFRVTGKGGKERQVFLSPNCVEALDQYLAVRERYGADTDALFLSRKHQRISVDAVQSLVKKHSQKAGLPPVSPHKLRHTAATLMLDNGVDIRTIAEVLGHSSVSTTQIYTHVQAERLRNACAANPASGF